MAILTRDQLRKAGACQEALDKFCIMFGQWVDISEGTAKQAARVFSFNELGWFAERILKLKHSTGPASDCPLCQIVDEPCGADDWIELARVYNEQFADAEQKQANLEGIAQ